ncbi:MAG: hypothetical protein K6U88_11640, partial [Dehalococcoidia bacterium]|nr:hypothetical protein [Dehalococcoidia bacterium]
MAVVTRSPLTGTVTDSHVGGWSGARRKWAGVDGLVFRGRAAHPRYADGGGGRVAAPGPAALPAPGAASTHGQTISSSLSFSSGTTPFFQPRTR